VDLRDVAVIDDDDDARAAISSLLAGAGYATVPFDTAAAAVSAAKRGELPKLVLMDMLLPGESAGRAIADIRRERPESLVVALTSFQREQFVFEALRAGAVGYLLKQQALQELPSLLAVVAAGGSPLSPTVARRVIAAFRDPSENFEPLSEREQQILARFAAGESYGSAAVALGISIDTVRTHVRRLYCKLSVTNRSEAVVAALRRGLLR
jgi:DNA-binding NarL/FixJ family response regulator